jgi:hypothetical protein
MVGDWRLDDTITDIMLDSVGAVLLNLRGLNEHVRA